MRTLTFTDQDIAVLKQLVIAAGKSPHTGDSGMMTASHYLTLIDQQLDESTEENATDPVSSKEHANG